MTYHFKFGGSTAGRTLNCPGWVKLAEDVPKGGSSKAADRGTVAHNACELLFKDENVAYEDLFDHQDTLRCGKEELDEKLLYEKVVPAFEEMCNLLEHYDCNDPEAEVQVEFDKEIGGTVDMLGSSLTGNTLIVMDYKFGDGHMVYAKENDQAQFYAWCSIVSQPVAEDEDLFIAGAVHLIILQPSDRKKELVDIWETTGDDILAWGERYLDAVEIAETSVKGENLCSGSWCSFCPNEATCPEKVGKVERALATITQPLTVKEEIKDPLILVTFEEALILADELGGWVKTVQAAAKKQIEEYGTAIPGWKVVAKSATRSWVDPKKAMASLARIIGKKEAIEPEKIISVAVAEKKYKKLKKPFNMQKHIQKVSSGTKLVPESHKAPAIERQKKEEETQAALANIGEEAQYLIEQAQG